MRGVRRRGDLLAILSVLSLGTGPCLPEAKAGAASNVFVTVEAASGVENAGEGFAVEDSGEVRITPRRDWRLVSPPGGRAFVAPGRPAVWKVAIEGVSEEEEEAFGAFVRHVADVDGGELWTREGTNALVAVSITCEPRDLPAKERISVTGPGGYLFERKDGRYEEVRGSEGFSASEINSKQSSTCTGTRPRPGYGTARSRRTTGRAGPPTRSSSRW